MVVSTCWMCVALCMFSSGTALLCYKCQSSVECDNLSINMTTECEEANSSCFTGVNSRGCLANCTQNASNTICCDSDRCNINGTVKPVPSSSMTPTLLVSGVGTVPSITPMPPLSGSGIECYICSQMTEDRCLVNPTNIALDRVRITKCNADEVCMVRLYMVFGFVNHMERHCSPKSACQYSDECSNSNTGGYCVRCCDCDLCNSKDARTSVSCQTCYSCSQSSHSNKCEVTEVNINAGFVTEKTCATGQLCGTRSFNDTISRDCYDPVHCDDNISGGCVSCCNDTLCNNGKIDGATCNATITGQVMKCYSCSQSSHTKCEVTEVNINAGFVTEKTCATGQLCGTRSFNDTISRDCYDPVHCDDSISGGVSCCNDTLCNNGKLDGDTCNATITGQVMKCYSCSQSSHTKCEVTEVNINAEFVTEKTCATGQLCGTRLFNDTISRDCYDTVHCDDSISGDCVSCCNGALCNTMKIDGATCSATISGQVFSITLVSLVLGYLLAG